MTKNDKTTNRLTCVKGTSVLNLKEFSINKRTVKLKEESL